MLKLEASTWYCGNMTHQSTNVYCYWGLCGTYICIRICTTVGSAAWAWVGLKDRAFISQFCWFPCWCRLGWFMFWFWLPLAGSPPEPAKSGLRLTIPLMWNTAVLLTDVGVWFLFMLLNCLMMSVKSFPLIVSFA